MTTPEPFDPAAAASALLQARRSHRGTAALQPPPPDRPAAYAVQDATLAALGPVRGWKVGAKNLAMEPTAAPLPAAGLLATGCSLQGPAWQVRGIELEVAVRLGRDLAPSDAHLGAHELQQAIDAVLPVIEVVETRLADWRQADPLAQLADLQSHGALVLGAPVAPTAERLDLRLAQIELLFDSQAVASARGAHPAPDLWRLLGWLAWHAVQRGLPLRAGDIVTTGSCSGMLFAGEGCHVLGAVHGLGRVELRF